MPAEPFGPRLRRLMDRASFSVDELTARIHSMPHHAGTRPEFVRGHILRWLESDNEIHATHMSITQLLDLKEALSCSTDELLGVESPVVRGLRKALEPGVESPLYGLHEYGLAFLRSLLPESEGG